MNTYVGQKYLNANLNSLCTAIDLLITDNTNACTHAHVTFLCVRGKKHGESRRKLEKVQRFVQSWRHSTQPL